MRTDVHLFDLDKQIADSMVSLEYALLDRKQSLILVRGNELWQWQLARVHLNSKTSTETNGVEQVGGDGYRSDP